MATHMSRFPDIVTKESTQEIKVVATARVVGAGPLQAWQFAIWYKFRCELFYSMSMAVGADTSKVNKIA